MFYLQCFDKLTQRRAHRTLDGYVGGCLRAFRFTVRTEIRVASLSFSLSYTNTGRVEPALTPITANIESVKQQKTDCQKRTKKKYLLTQDSSNHIES